MAGTGERGHSNGPYADSLPLSGHFQGGEGGGGGAGSGGRLESAAPRSQHIGLKMTLVALIILRYVCWGKNFFKFFFSPQTWGPSRGEGQDFFP